MNRKLPRLITCVAALLVASGSLVALNSQAGATLNIPLPANAMPGAAEPVPASQACSPVACYAVGTYESDIPATPQSELVGAPVVGVPEGFIATSTDGESTWTSEAAPLPPGADLTIGGSEIGGVTCSGEACFSVGGYDDSAGIGEAVIETLADGSWSPTEVSLPYAPTPSYFYTGIIGCSSSTSCVAVGELILSSTIQNDSVVLSGLDPIIIGFSGGSWTAVASPTPSDGEHVDGQTVGTLGSGDLGSPYLIDGYYTTMSGVAESYTVTGEPGGAWTASSSSAPASAALVPPPSDTSAPVAAVQLQSASVVAANAPTARSRSTYRHRHVRAKAKRRGVDRRRLDRRRAAVRRSAVVRILER